MSEKQKPSPDEALHTRDQLTDFMLRHRRMLELLFHGKLFEKVEGSKAYRGKEWRNVAEHCIKVGHGLEALGELLGLERGEIEDMVQTGVIHDWNKRLTKDPAAFSPGERDSVEAHAAQLLAKHDPKGLYIDATEPRGLPRLESDAATVAEHCVHFVDLSCMPQGFVPPEERIAELRQRHAGIDYEKDHPHFWDRKEALTKKEEAMFLDLIRAKGTDVPEGTRVCDLIAARTRR